jgi:hypothetical protein
LRQLVRLVLDQTIEVVDQLAHALVWERLVKSYAFELPQLSLSLYQCLDLVVHG